jgi:hypothetical protein
MSSQSDFPKGTDQTVKPQKVDLMRSAHTRLEISSIPSSDAVTALALILSEMNGPKTCDGAAGLSSVAEAYDETEGYCIEAHAILDQLSAKGFVISPIGKDRSLGPKIRDTAACIHRG